MRLLSLAWCRTIAILATVLLVGPVATSGSGTVIGFLKWEVQEAATNRVLARGEGPVYVKDVVINNLTRRGDRFTPKYIRLNDQFGLHMAEFPDPTMNHKSGFGIVGHRYDHPTGFSWEWFEIESRERAAKLQEGGELGIQLKQVGSDWEIARTVFTTDISLRISHDLDTPGATYWRINIAKGSSITWPSLIHGRVVPN